MNTQNATGKVFTRKQFADAVTQRHRSKDAARIARFERSAYSLGLQPCTYSAQQAGLLLIS